VITSRGEKRKDGMVGIVIFGKGRKCGRNNLYRKLRNDHGTKVHGMNNKGDELGKQL